MQLRIQMRKKTLMQFILTSMLCAQLVFTIQAAPKVWTLTLNPVADTYVREGSPDLNYGQSDEMLCGRHETLGRFNSLLRFDLSGISPEWDIKSVSLKLQKNTGVGSGPLSINLHELSAANENWVGGTGKGAAEAGSATWNKRGASPWAGSPGASTPTEDYLSEILSTYTGSVTAGSALFESSDAWTDAVKRNAGGALNLGIGLDFSASGAYLRFSTSEGAVPPQLIIKYTGIIPVPQDPLRVDANRWSTVPQGITNHSVFTERWTDSLFLSAVQASDISTELPEGILSNEAFCRWADHEKFSTIVNYDLNLHDWRAGKSLEFMVYSKVATGQTVSLALLSDNEETDWKDYYWFDFVVDWQGWKTFRLPFATFTPYENPAGWNQIDSIFFFSKAGKHQPNPYTELAIGGFKLLPDAVEATSSQQAVVQEAFIYKTDLKDQPQPLNHGFPEIDSTSEMTSAPFLHQSYFRAERALLKYYPRFTPGFPSFDPAGKVYINSGERIQWKDSDGQWTEVAIKPLLIQWAKENGWKGLNNKWGMQSADPIIRFDSEGNAYALYQVEELDEAGKQISWKNRTVLLLHSRDGLKTWTVYQLPGRLARFEKIDGHNPDALKLPPVILLGDYKYFKDADQAGYILIPEKQPDGTLQLPEPVQYASNCISVGYHSGDANIAVTSGEKVYIVFGWVPPPTVMDHTKWGRDLGRLDVSGIHIEYGFSDYQSFTTDYSKDPSKYPDVDLSDPENWGWSHVNARQYGLPFIPEDHPGLGLVFQHSAPWVGYGFGKNGIPTFVVEYDIKTRTVGAPVYVGSGGRTLDVHNWPAMTLDSAGRLHVLINGHGEPPVYTHTVNPCDISSWTDPAYALRDDVNDPAVDDIGSYSYATLNCDRSDTLHVVTRLQEFGLIAYRKPLNQPWQRTGVVMKKFRTGYVSMSQRMAYDSVTDRLFLAYVSHGALKPLSWDEYQFFNFIWPDLEKDIYGPPSQTRQMMYRPMFMKEMMILVSPDRGQTWLPALTDDFR